MSAGAHNKTDEVSITCLDFPDSEPSTFWIGTEEGSVYQANRYDRASSKAGLNTEDIYRGHAGPVTGLHFHPSSGSIDFSDLFITSSVDWTVKLWRAKAGKPTSGVTSTSSKEQAERAKTPIHSFEEADDYVFDVKWHPSHPAVFGSVDGNGKFDLWNLNQDVEVSRLQSYAGVCLMLILQRSRWSRPKYASEHSTNWHGTVIPFLVKSD
jgi:dynein intermediate chain